MVEKLDPCQSNRSLPQTTLTITTKYSLKLRKMTDWKSPAISWTLVAVAVTVGARYYRKQSTNKRGGNRRVSTSDSDQIVRRPLENKSKKKKEKAAVKSDTSDQNNSDRSEAPVRSVEGSSNGDLRPRKQNKKQDKTREAASSAVEMVADTSRSVTADDREEETSNKDFARQLLNVKNGMTLAGPQKNAQRIRTEKQSKAEARGSFNTEVSGSNSTTGGDADDDLSPVMSPSLTEVTLDTTGVADMLESPGPGPSVLRLTESTQPVHQKQQQKKAAVPELTKKQRQNKAKSEARKAEKREAEAGRKIQLEKQMHTARQAERDQAKLAQPKVPSASAWAQGTSNGDNKSSIIANDPMLDTFETISKEDVAQPKAQSPETFASKPDAGSGVANVNVPEANGFTGTNGTDSSWYNDLSEEEQMKRIVEEAQNEKWETVPVKGRAKKAKATANVTAADVDKQKHPFGDVDFEQTL